MADAAYRKAYYQSHKEEIKARSAARYDAKKAEILEKDRLKREAHRIQKYGCPDLRINTIGVPRSDPAYMKLWWDVHRDEQVAKRRLQYANNRQEILKKQREYTSHPDVAARMRARVLAWQKANPALVNKKNAAWASSHPEAKSVQKAKRRAFMKAAEGSHTRDEVIAILQFQNYVCNNPYCLADLRIAKKQLDHIVALSKGGSNYASNLQWLCERCNTSKCDTPWDLWLEFQHAEFGQTLVG